MKAISRELATADVSPESELALLFFADLPFSLVRTNKSATDIPSASASPIWRPVSTPELGDAVDCFGIDALGTLEPKKCNVTRYPAIRLRIVRLGNLGFTAEELETCCSDRLV